MSLHFIYLSFLYPTPHFPSHFTPTLIFPLQTPSLRICIYFPFLEQWIYSHLVPYSMPDLCGSVDCSLFFIDLTTNIHV